MTPPQPYLTSSASPCVISEGEAFGYFYGQTSRTILVARSDSSTRPWATIVGGGFGWPTQRYLVNVGYHERLAAFWLTPSKREKMVELLDSMCVDFTTIDPIRVVEREKGNYVGDKTTVGHQALAIAVKPETLSREKGAEVVEACKALLSEHGVDDVECLIRQAECFSSAGPLKLQEPAPCSNDAANFRVPTTSTLGTSIVTTRTPDVEGTRGFYVASSESPGKLYFLTCRHVILPFNSAEENLEYKYTEPRIGIFQPSAESLKLLRQRGVDDIKYLRETVELRLEWLGDVEKREGDRIEAQRDDSRFRIKTFQRQVEEIKSEIIALNTWEDPSNRVIGHVVYSPPLCAGTSPQEYTLDVCICEVDQSRLDTENFLGNVVVWGSSESRILAREYGFEPLDDGIQKLKGLTPVEEMINLKTKSLSDDGDDTGCLAVSKRGAKSGVTFGKANNLPSLRTYFATGPDTKKFRALEWGIFQYDQGPETNMFSGGGGDSGATVFDNDGRILGLLTGWSGTEPLADITYVMPAEFALEEISKRWQKVHTDVLGRV